MTLYAVFSLPWTQTWLCFVSRANSSTLSTVGHFECMLLLMSRWTPTYISMWLLWSGSVWSMRISLVGQLPSLLLAIIIIIMEGPSWGCTSFAPVWPTRIRLVGRVHSIVLLPPLPLVPLKHQIGGPGVGPSENMDNLLDIKAQWPVIIIVVLKAIQEDFHDQQWTVNNSCPVWLRWPQGSSKGLMLQKKGANMLE